MGKAVDRVAHEEFKDLLLSMMDRKQALDLLTDIDWLNGFDSGWHAVVDWCAGHSGDTEKFLPFKEMINYDRFIEETKKALNNG